MLALPAEGKNEFHRQRVNYYFANYEGPVKIAWRQSVFKSASLFKFAR